MSLTHTHAGDGVSMATESSDSLSAGGVCCSSSVYCDPTSDLLSLMSLKAAGSGGTTVAPAGQSKGNEGIAEAGIIFNVFVFTGWTLCLFWV